MKKVLLFGFLSFFLLGGVANDVDAQRGSRNSTDEYFDESGNFLSKLWYAGGVNLNWGGTSLGGAPGTIFQFGLSPMVGYKVFDRFSVGPRIEFSYLSGRFDFRNPQGDAKFNSVNLGLGVFSRYLFNGGIFIHGEYQSLTEEEPLRYNSQENSIETGEIRSDNLFIGAGYASGGIVGFEVSVLYNVNEDFTSDNLPLVYRFGVNYKFLQ